jgi:hypothetical protein
MGRRWRVSVAAKNTDRAAERASFFTNSLSFEAACLGINRNAPAPPPGRHRRRFKLPAVRDLASMSHELFAQATETVEM